MRPSAAVSGIVLGTSFAIFFGLVVVTGIFWWIRDDAPRLSAEIPVLARSTLMFLGLTALAAGGFVAALRGSRWQWLMFALTALAIAAIGRQFWPA